MNITREQFQSYEDVRESGITNMFDGKRVSELSGLSTEQILEIMRDYKNLSEKFIN